MKKSRMLFWINGFLLHYSLAYYLQSELNADFFGIIDINEKPKKFFKNQKFVNFKKVWYYHDNIKKSQKNIDFEFLNKFEKKNKINLWKYALNERFFYQHNRFYKFKKEEIISILEQELNLFESILNEVKPTHFLTYDPVLHHQKLLLDLCRSKGIKVLSVIIATGIENKTLVVEDGSDYDLNENMINLDITKEKKYSKSDIQNYDSIQTNYIKKRTGNYSNKFLALRNYLISSNTTSTSSNFMYYGKNKFAVIKDALNFEIQRKINLMNLKKLSTPSPDLKTSYVYYPLNIDEEMNVLHYAPYYTDQIEVIRNISKSIPINYLLYVKEHIAAGIRRWHDVNYYNQILEIPNVVLVRPDFDNNELIKNSQLLVTTRGSSVIKAMKYGKSTIIFGEHPAKIMPSVFKVESLNSLPDLIRNALDFQVSSSEFLRYQELIKNRLFEFNTFEYEIKRDESFFSGGILSDVEILNDSMINFLNLNKDSFKEMISAHLKIINEDNRLNNQ